MISQLPRPITRYGGDNDDPYNEADDDSNALLPFHSYLKVFTVILIIVPFSFFF
jgi:hypothetical protein